MNCDNIENLIPFLDDGSLPEGTIKEVREHLSECPSCLKEYKEINDIVRIAKDTLRVKNFPSDEEFLYSLNKRIEKDERNTRIYRVFFSAAAMFIMVIGAALFFKLNYVNDSEPLKYVKNSSIDFYKYVAENYLETRDFLELVDVSYINEAARIDVTDNPYVEVTLNDIVLNEDENVISSYFNNER